MSEPKPYNSKFQSVVMLGDCEVEVILHGYQSAGFPRMTEIMTKTMDFLKTLNAQEAPKQ